MTHLPPMPLEVHESVHRKLPAQIPTMDVRAACSNCQGAYVACATFDYLLGSACMPLLYVS